MADDAPITLLVQTFAGLSLPPTLAIPLPRATPISAAYSAITSRLPAGARYIVTTTSNRALLPSSPATLATLSSPHDAFLPLRLSLPLCGGKGGFGSQLRAAGGRMASRKKRRGAAADEHGSSRNLDGRRLRTVAEAKALAEYLAIRPEMERREKEERRKRWQQVVDSAEERTEELKSGAKGKVDGKWVESKEEAEERTREAVRAAMKALDDEEMEEEDDEESSGEGEGREEEEKGGSSAGTTPPETGAKSKSLVCYGFDDEDDEFLSDDENEEVKGKGKEVVR